MLSGLETLLGYRAHQSELQFLHLEDGSSGRLLPFPHRCLGQACCRQDDDLGRSPRQFADQERLYDGGNAAGRQRRPPRPPPPWAPDGECVGACKLEPHRLQRVGGHRLLSACGSPIQALVFSVQGAVAEGRGRGAMGAGSHSSRLPLSLALDCPWTKA